MSIPATDWAWEQKCKPMEKLILVLLADHMNGKTTRLNPGIARLMARSGMSRQGVVDQIFSLENRGLVLVERSKGAVNHYRLPVSPVDQSAPLTSQPDGLPPVSQLDYHQSAPLTGPVSPVDLNRKEPEYEPEVKPEPAEATSSKAKKPKNVPQEKFDPASILIPEQLDTEEFREAWAMFGKHRKEIGKAFTPTAAEMAIKKLAKMGQSRAIAALNHSAENSWQGIFEEKLTPTEAKKAQDAKPKPAPNYEIPGDAFLRAQGIPI